MKKPIALLLALLPVLVSGQLATQPIEGIGKFKVSKSTLAIIPELESELKTKVKQAKTFTDVTRAKYISKGYAILELINDTTSYYGPAEASQCSQAKVYLLPKYTISGLEIKNLKLTFFGGVLIEVQCDGSSEFDEALKLKYGSGEESNTEKEVPCQFTYTGNKVVYKARKNTISWNGASTSAELVIENFYDEKCKEYFLHYLSIKDVKGAIAHDSCWHNSVRRRALARQAEKKKGLGEL